MSSKHYIIFITAAFLSSCSSNHHQSEKISIPTEVAGNLDRELIKSVMKNNAGDIKNCYEKALKIDSNFSGTLNCKWDININGNTQNVKVESADLNSDFIIDCVSIVLKSMKFPKAPNGETSNVIYPIIFKKK